MHNFDIDSEIGPSDPDLGLKCKKGTCDPDPLKSN